MSGFYLSFFIPINFIRDISFLESKTMNTLLINITENKLTTIQIASIRPNPLIILIPNINSIVATMKPVTFESHIALHDLLNQVFTAFSKSFHSLSSALTLSNMSIFASIAIPTESIRPAIEASVRTIPKVLRIARTITI